MLLEEYINRVAAITHVEILGFETIKTRYNDTFKVPKVKGVEFEIKLKEITTKSPENTKEKWIYTCKANPIDDISLKFCEKFDKFCIGINKYKVKNQI